MSEGQDEQQQTEQDPWTNVHSPVWVQLPCCNDDAHPARVARVKAQALFVEIPTMTHGQRPLIAPEQGAACLATWSVGDSAAEVPVRFEGRQDEFPPTWRFDATGPQNLVQRRRFDRMAWTQPVKLLVPTSIAPVQGFAVDLGEGGMQVVLDAGVERPAHNDLKVELRFFSGDLTLNASIVWWSEEIEGRRQVGLGFDRASEMDREKIRGHLFELRRRQSLF